MQEELAERERFAQEFQTCEEVQRARQKEDVSDEAGAAEPIASSASKTPRKPNPRVFLEVEVRGPGLLGKPGKLEGSGRLEFELFADVVPRTADNFRCLCTGERGGGLHFEDSVFHRIIPGFMAQGGDFTDGDGTGGRSIYGPTFADEAFTRRHDARGLLSMANSGKNTNGSQFFVLFRPTPNLDGKHVVFGQLSRSCSGADQLLKKMEDRGTKAGDVKGLVTVVACGELRDEPARKKRRRSESP